MAGFRCATLVLVLAGCWCVMGADLNHKTKAPTRFSDSKAIAQDERWIPFNTSSNPSRFQTLILAPGNFSRGVELTEFHYYIPRGSKIRGIVFTVQQCSKGIKQSWQVLGSLVSAEKQLTKLFLTHSMNPHVAEEGCYSPQSRVELGGMTEMWGIDKAEATDFDRDTFGVLLQVHMDPHRRKRNATDEPSTTTTTTTTTTQDTTEASTTRPSTATPTTEPAPVPGILYFQNPQLTIYYEAACPLGGMVSGVQCSDDGESVVSAPLSVHSELVIPSNNVLVLEMDKYRENVQFSGVSNLVPPAFITVDGKLTVGGELVASFSQVPPADVTETWHVVHSNGGNVVGAFSKMSANVTDLGLIMGAAESVCFAIDVRVQNHGTFFNITTRRHNACIEAAQRHPGVAAAIALSVIGAFLTLITIVVIWRKRRFNRSRAAILSSPLAEEAELQEMRVMDPAGYAETAKMIESTSGRFEIGDDEIDDPEL